MIRYRLMKKIYIFVVAFLMAIAIIAVIRYTIWQFGKRRGPTNNPSEYNGKMLEMLQPLIKDSRDFVESESVRKYFSWPTPEHPKSINDVTDPKESSFHFVYYDNVYTSFYKINEELRIRIIARNRRGEQKLFGGDYFRVRLVDKHNHKTVIMGNVNDHDDGTYTATVRLQNTGEFLLEVILIHPSEAVDLLRRVTSTKSSPGLQFNGVFQEKSWKEETDCNVWLSSVQNNALEKQKLELCNFTHPELGHPWFCEKPKELDCSSIKLYIVTRTNEVSALLEQSGLFKKETNLRVQIGKRTVIKVKKPPYHIDLPKSPLPRCIRGKADSVPPVPSGQFVKGKWQSFHCDAKNFSLEWEKTACLSNKNIYILGDSTIRQWYGYLLKNPFLVWLHKIANIFGGDRICATEITSAENIWEPRTAVDASHSLFLHFSAHGPPLQNGGSPYSQPYIADRIDAIEGGKDTVLAFTVGTHLLLYDPSLFVQRLESINQAVSRLLKRSPGTVVLYKGFNVFEMDNFFSNQCCVSDWLAFRYDRIARNMFKDSKNIVFLDMWDLSASHHTKPSGLHTQQSLVQKEIDLFLSYICPNLKLS